MLLEGHPRDLGDLVVRRALPQRELRCVGPFVFLDHIGPVTFEPGGGIDVRPHPHIALATVTYLFEGTFVHRDSLGSLQAIHPGDVNWMVAGRGIAHSERTSAETRALGSTLHGIQTWVALPKAQEEMAPVFEHHPSATLPKLQQAGVELTVIAGEAYGKTAPTSVLAPTLYVHGVLAAGSTLVVDTTHEERAVYVVEGQIICDGQKFGAGAMLVLEPGAHVEVLAPVASRVMLVGGAPLDGPRHMWWNFVSTSKERIEQAKDDWRAGRFDKIPGDDVEFMALPEK